MTWDRWRLLDDADFLCFLIISRIFLFVGCCWWREPF